MPNQDEPEDREGLYVQHPDMLKQEPRDFLLIGRVVKRNCRPLTIAEAKHLQRNSVLFKLDAEIRDLQRQAGYERQVNQNEKAKKRLGIKEMANGPMKNAMIEYEKRKFQEQSTVNA